MRDLISRETAKMTLKNYGLNQYMMERMERWLDAQPAVDAVSVVRGEWIKDNLGTVICSECKRPRRDNRVNHINFCNSCGAKMKGADNE